jgi:hypothetical protein
MKFETKNVVLPQGTSYIGKIHISFDVLVQLFGQPSRGSADNKTTVQWELRFEDDTFANIYNWKNGKPYLKEKGIDVEDITEWCIGGENKKAEIYIKEEVRKFLNK